MDNTNTTPIISLGLRKKSFAIDGDENRVIYLDPSDMGIINRIDVFGKQIDTIIEKLKDVPADQLGSRIVEVDVEMREAIDKIFDYEVCAVCVPSGTMFDVVDGKFKFEIVVQGLSNVYTNTISTEMKKINDRISSHTQKYIKK